MEIEVYQINGSRDKNRVRLESLNNTRLYQGAGRIDSSIYDKVFSGTVNCTDLEQVYELFNLDPPEGHKGRLMSVSDVVIVSDEQDKLLPGAYFCDTVGFQEISFSPDKTVDLISDERGEQEDIER